MYRQYFYIIIFLLSTLSVNGQQPEEQKFVLYTTSSGLSDNNVTGLAQDGRGYLWITTTAGLNRFNGREFVQYHSNNDSNSLPAEEITGLKWLNKDELALFSSGIHLINTRTGKSSNLFIPYHNKKYQFKFNMIMRSRGDSEGNIYALTRSGFYHFDKYRKLVYRYDYHKEQEVPYTHFYFGTELLDLDKYRFLIVTVAGLYLYDKRTRELNKMSEGDVPELDEFLDYNRHRNYQFFQIKEGEFLILKYLSNSLCYVNLKKRIKSVSDLPIDSANLEIAYRSKLVYAGDNNYYITGHNSGYYRLMVQPSTGAVKMDKKKYFSSFLCNNMLVDQEKRLWIATNKGLFREKTHNNSVNIALVPTPIEVNFPNVTITDIYAASDKIYASTKEAGLLQYDKRSLSFEKQFLFKSIKQNHVRTMEPTSGSSLLLGTLGAPILFDINNKVAKDFIPPDWDIKGHWTSNMLKDRKGDIWISSYNIYNYNPTSGKFNKIPNEKQLLEVPFIIKEDQQGNIWFGGHGLARYNRKLQAYDLVLDSFPFIKMPDKQVDALAIDRYNHVWFNSNNNGLIAYNIQQKKFDHYTTSDGLPDNNVSSVIAVGDKLWIACYSGLACIDLKSRKIVSFGKEDGFPTMPIYRNSRFFYDSLEQQLYIGFSRAIARFNPDHILHRKAPPQLFFENVLLNGKENIFLPGQTISTTWKDDELRITIGTISYSENMNQHFAYRIANGKETPWISLGKQPSFSLFNLSPGNHKIEVKVYSPENRWPEQIKHMQLVVEPPLWRKDWFIALTVVLLIILIYLLVKWRTGVVRKKEMEKTHLQKLKAEHYKNEFELEQIANYFSSSLADKRTEDEVLWDVAENLIGRMNYEDCIIYLWNKNKTKMIQKAGWGPKGKPEIIATDIFEVEPGQGIVGQVIATKQAILINDTRKDPRYRVDDQYRLSEVAVPIIHNDELLGVIDSENSQANYFTERDINIMTTIATLLGNKLIQLESTRSLEAKQKEIVGINEQLAEARLSALQAQMNPHFVFNALNSIKRMILDSDNEKASRYLSKFALMIRMTLEHSKQVFVTLEDNIEYIEAYLDMEKLRFDGSFNYAIHVDEEIDTTETMLPSMMIQPLVENAVWHGLMQASGDKKIRISFNLEEDKLVCSVEDNGIGILQSTELKQKQRPVHRSVGLENLQKRLNIINEKYNCDCSLQILDVKTTGINGSGTKAILQCNFVNA